MLGAQKKADCSALQSAFSSSLFKQPGLLLAHPEYRRGYS
jgi:hypothetical protein